MSNINWEDWQPTDDESARKLMQIVTYICDQQPTHDWHFVRKIDGDGPWSVTCSCGERYEVKKP